MTKLSGSPTIRVISTRYDGRPRDEWPAQLLEWKPTRLCLRVGAGAEEIVNGFRRRLITDSFLALYWTDRWYNVWQFDRTEGVLRYANVATPCSFDGSVLRWTDLDIDVVQYADGAAEVRDEEEFRRRSAALSYPEDIIRSALAARDELLRLAETRLFPFQRWNHSISP
jgi:protein associated with RNAse G/E